MKTTTSNRILRGLALAASASVVLLAGCATGPNANPADVQPRGLPHQR
jgi:phospholipid-binding lipoprotein MlaA